MARDRAEGAGSAVLKDKDTGESKIREAGIVLAEEGRESELKRCINGFIEFMFGPEWCVDWGREKMAEERGRANAEFGAAQAIERSTGTSGPARAVQQEQTRTLDSEPHRGR